MQRRGEPQSVNRDAEAAVAADSLAPFAVVVKGPPASIDTGAKLGAGDGPVGVLASPMISRTAPMIVMTIRTLRSV